MSTKKIFVAIILVVGLIVVKHFYHQNHGAQMSAVLVDVAAVKTEKIPIEVQAIGTLTAVQNTQITSQATGQVAKILVTDGAFVKQGTPIIQLDDAVNRAKFTAAKADFAYSEMDYKRKVLLGKQGAIAKQAIDQAEADIQEKKAALAMSQLAVDQMVLSAPFDGVLGKIKVSPGDYVTAGQNITSLTDIQHLRVEYTVGEKYLPQLTLNQAVHIRTSIYPDKIFVGKIAFISPTINTNDRTIDLYADIPNDNQLLTAGMFVNVTHQLGVDNHAITVPAVSLVPTIEGQQVFKIENTTVASVPVVILQRLQNTVQVSGDLKPGDLVVVAGQQKLREGMSVKINSNSR